MRKVASAPCLASLGNQGTATTGGVGHHQSSGMHKSASVPVLHNTKHKSGFHRDAPLLERPPRAFLGERSRSVEPSRGRVRAAALPMDASYFHQSSLFQAMVNPVELHYIVDSLDQSRERLEEAIQEVSISASVPHGIMGLSCLIDDPATIGHVNRGGLPRAPDLLGAPRGSESKHYLEEAACLSTPFLLETEGGNFRELHMQQVQRLALETETAMQMRVAQDLSSARVFEGAKIPSPDNSPQRRLARLRSIGKRRPSDDQLPVATDIPVKPDTLLEQQGGEQLAPALPDEERELISAIFSTDEVDSEPPNMLTLDDEDLVGSTRAHELLEPPAHDELDMMVTQSMDEDDLPPTVAARIRAKQAAAMLWPADANARSLAIGEF